MARQLELQLWNNLSDVHEPHAAHIVLALETRLATLISFTQYVASHCSRTPVPAQRALKSVSHRQTTLQLLALHCLGCMSREWADGALSLTFMRRPSSFVRAINALRGPLLLQVALANDPLLSIVAHDFLAMWLEVHCLNWAQEASRFR
jgi:hypothetical protein